MKMREFDHNCDYGKVKFRSVGPFQRKASGELWRAGHHIFGLCAAYNHATDPGDYRTDRLHAIGNKYARAIKKRISTLGYIKDVHYKEFESGLYWPIKDVE